MSAEYPSSHTLVVMPGDGPCAHQVRGFRAVSQSHGGFGAAPHVTGPWHDRPASCPGLPSVTRGTQVHESGSNWSPDGHGGVGQLSWQPAACDPMNRVPKSKARAPEGAPALTFFSIGYPTLIFCKLIVCTPH